MITRMTRLLLCLMAVLAWLPARAQEAESEKRFRQLNPPMTWEFQAPPESIPAPKVQPLRAPIRDHLVKIAYIIPYDRTERPCARAALKSGMLIAQGYLRDQMKLYGFGEKTISFENDPDQPGTPLVHVFKETNSTRTAAWFRGSGAFDSYYTLRQSASSAGLGTYPGFSDGEVWVLVGDVCQMHEDGTIDGRNQAGAGSPVGGSGGGVCVVPNFSMTFMKNDLAFLWDLRSLTSGPPVNLGDDLAPYVPGPGPYNLTYGTSFQWYEGNTVSGLASTMVGSVIHELSHGLGLNHDYKLDANCHGNLNGNGFRGFRGNLDHASFPSDISRLSYGCALQLSASRFMRPPMDYTDNTPPVITPVTVGNVAQDPVTRNLKITFSARDAQSNLAMAVIKGPGTMADSLSMADEMPLSGKSGTWTFNIYDYTPNTDTQWSITVLDEWGNAASQNVTVKGLSADNIAPPIPYFSASAYAFELGGSVVFNATNSCAHVYQSSTGTFTTDYYTTPLQFSWDLDGDGVFELPWSSSKTVVQQYSNVGTYKVRMKVMDNNGAVSTSPPIPIQVYVNPPQIQTHPAPQTVDPGATVQFSVEATGKGTLTYQWKRGTTPLQENTRIEGVASPVLTLHGAAQSDEGVYCCEVTNQGGTVICNSARLDVNDPPRIQMNPASQTVNPNGAITFSVATTGTAPLTYRWLRAAAPLSDDTRLSGTASPTLTINPVRDADAGFYACVVRNNLGSTTSQAARLTVNPTLTQASLYGSPAPAGTTICTSGSQVTARLPGTTATLAGGASRWVCTGWKAVGAAPASGTGASVTFIIDQPTTITWQWKLQHKLSISVLPSAAAGTVTLGDGKTAPPAWCDAGSTLVLKALYKPFFRFGAWWGDTHSTNSSLSLKADAPLTLQALFYDRRSGVANWPAYR